MATALIVGVLGQDGRYLGEYLTAHGYRVIGTTHRAGISTPPWCHSLRRLDLTDSLAIANLMTEAVPNEVYNLAARASSAELFDDPVATGEINGLAVTRLLDAIEQHAPDARFCQALSSEVFAYTTESPQSETTVAAPANAYGAAKAYAWHITKAFREQRSVFACGAILYNHESPHRPEHFVTRKITSAAARIADGSKEVLELGNAEHRRDWGHARDYVRAMNLMVNGPAADDYVIATGVTHTVADFCAEAFGHLGLDYRDHVRFYPTGTRRHEHCELRGNPSKAAAILGWHAETHLNSLVAEMVDHDIDRLRTLKGKNLP